MKKILTVMAAAALFLSVACNNEKKDDKAKTNEPAKTDMTGKEDPAKLADHVCTDKCKDGNHVYAHGEKGHVCTAKCSNM